MKALVVYESLWGNTAAVARSIAEGLGEGARACPPDEVSADELAAADLVVAGAPVMAFGLPKDAMRANIEATDRARPPDLSHPSLRSWLDRLPSGHGRAAAFETRIWWSPGGATGAIEDRLSKAGYGRLRPPAKFVVTGTQGPLREGELDRARRWGEELKDAMAVAR